MNPERWSLGIRVAAAAASGLILVAAFPPIDLGWIAFLAPVPLLLALRGASARAGALLGLVAGVAFFSILLYWISYFGYLAWIALVLLEAGFFALCGLFAARAARLGLAGRVVGIPLLFAGAELARGRFPFGGFTWGSLGSSLHAGGPTVHVVKLVGMSGLSALMIAIAALLAEAVLAQDLQSRMTPAVVGAALAVAPNLIPIGPPRARGVEFVSTPTIDVTAVQGNVPRERFTGLGRRGRTGPEDTVIVDNHVRVTERLAGEPAPDLIVWPENSFDRDPRANPEMLQPVATLVGGLGAPLLFGAILDHGARFTNSNLLIDGTGAILRRYDKRHLVPFGEYVPWPFLRKVVPVLDRELPYDGIPGRGPVVFDVGGKKVGSVICFESTYPELARAEVRAGARLLVVTTNNASFGTSPAARQHLAMSQMRAIEEGVPVVHAAIAGVSAIIDSDGHIERRAGLFRPALLRSRLIMGSGLTPFGRYGGAIELALALGALVAAALPFAVSLRARGVSRVSRGGGGEGA